MLIDDQGWYHVDVAVDHLPALDLGTFGTTEFSGDDYKYWLEDTMEYEHLHVMESPVKIDEDFAGGRGMIRVLVKAEEGHRVHLHQDKALCQLREVTNEDMEVYEALNGVKQISLMRNSYKNRQNT